MTVLKYASVNSIYGSVFFAKLFLFIWMFLFVFSNVIISLLSENIDSKASFNALQGIDFLLIVLCFLFSLVYRERLLGLQQFDRAVLFVLLILLLYFIYGWVVNGFVSASIYLRMFAYPILMLYVGALLARTISLNYFSLLYLFFGFVISLYVLLESLSPLFLYDVLNAGEFYSIKLNEYYINTEYLISIRERRFLNMEMFDHIHLFKPAGPTFNYPSTSYLLVFSFMVSRWYGYRFLSFFSLLALVAISTKAGYFCLIFIIWAEILYRMGFVRPLYIYVSAITALCLMIVIMSGYNNIHYHSLMSSVINIPFNLLGKGLGFGGSVTVDRVVTWDDQMLVGDSGVAILLNMLGIFGLFLMWLYLNLLRYSLNLSALTKDFKLHQLSALGFSIAVNSIIQELAVGPYAIGLFLIFLIFYLSGRRDDEKTSNGK